MTAGSSSLWLRAAFVSGLALALPAFAPLAGAAPSLVESLHDTSGEIDGHGLQGDILDAQDSDVAPGDGTAESYAEETGTSQVPYTWFASATAGADVLNSVGVELTRPVCCVVGESIATAFSEWVLENDTDQWLTGGMSGVYIPAGEILFMLGNFDPVAGQSRGFFDVTVRADGVVDPLFHYRLELVSTTGGFEEVEGSTDNVPIGLVFNGAGGVWGYTIAEAEFDFPVPDVAPYGELRIQHYMQAYGFSNFRSGEVGAGFSVKLGDPLQPLSGDSLRLLPEPEAVLLLGSSLLLLAMCRARLRAYFRSSGEWRSGTRCSSGPQTLLTRSPRCTAGRFWISVAQRTTFL